MNPKVRKIAAMYLISQGIFGLIWWAVLFLVPQSRNLFLPDGVQPIALLGFWLADFIFFILGSCYCGFIMLYRKQVDLRLFWFVAGGICYASFFCLGLSLLANGGWGSTILMLGAMSITLWIVVKIDE